jgi:hypothetical protein
MKIINIVHEKIIEQYKLGCEQIAESVYKESEKPWFNHEIAYKSYIKQCETLGKPFTEALKNDYSPPYLVLNENESIDDFIKLLAG